MQTLRMLFKELGLGVVVEVIILLGSRLTSNLPTVTSFFSIVQVDGVRSTHLTKCAILIITC